MGSAPLPRGWKNHTKSTMGYGLRTLDHGSSHEETGHASRHARPRRRRFAASAERP
jgi:hypothetical protein